MVMIKTDPAQTRLFRIPTFRRTRRRDLRGPARRLEVPEVQAGEGEV